MKKKAVLLLIAGIIIFIAGVLVPPEGEKIKTAGFTGR